MYFKKIFSGEIYEKNGASKTFICKCDVVLERDTISLLQSFMYGHRVSYINFEDYNKVYHTNYSETWSLLSNRDYTNFSKGNKILIRDIETRKIRPDKEWFVKVITDTKNDFEEIEI